MDEIIESTAGQETDGEILPRQVPGREVITENTDPQTQRQQPPVEIPPQEESPEFIGQTPPYDTNGRTEPGFDDEPGDYPAYESAGRVYRANRGRVIKAAMDSDLAEIRRVYPYVNSLEEAGPLYRALRFNRYAPMSPRQAWQRAVTVAGQKPPSTGSMAATAGPEREFFTAAELDRLTREELKDEAVYKKAMKSLIRL